MELATRARMATTMRASSRFSRLSLAYSAVVVGHALEEREQEGQDDHVYSPDSAGRISHLEIEVLHDVPLDAPR